MATLDPPTFAIGSWAFSKDHGASVRILDVATVWNHTVYQVWFPPLLSVVPVRADSLSQDHRNSIPRCLGCATNSNLARVSLCVFCPAFVQFIPGTRTSGYESWFCSGPKALNVIAQGNALGRLAGLIKSPERAQCLRLQFRPFRAFQLSIARYLGHCPRLSHYAALRLNHRANASCSIAEEWPEISGDVCQLRESCDHVAGGICRINGLHPPSKPCHRTQQYGRCIKRL